MKHLGPSFDIHTGGVDLIFPHHEDEIAQSEAATGQPFVRTWLHCAHLQIERLEDGQVDRQHRPGRRAARRAASRPRALRYALIAVHYRAPLNYSDDSLAAAAAALDRLDARRRGLDGVPRGRRRRPELAGRPGRRPTRAFGAALDDDLNVSAALAVVFDLVRDLNRRIDGRIAVDGRRRARRSPRCARSTRSSASCPTPADELDDGEPPRCSTSGRPRGRTATGRRPTGSATSSRSAGSPSRTRATASAGAAPLEAARG